MRPDKYTAGNIGDIMTDEATGKQYKLVNIYHIDVDGDSNDEKTYEWDEIKSEGGGTGSGTGEAVRADLAQNDPSAADYVKNRTHWAEPKLEVILAETRENVVTSWVNVIQSGHVPEHMLTTDKMYIVTVDSIQYRCVCYLGSDGYLALGDSRLHEIWNDDWTELIPDTTHPEDVPFCILYALNDDGGSFQYYEHYFEIYYPDEETHTLKIEKETGEIAVKPLDEKFIPESIARRSDPTSWNDLTDKPFGEDAATEVLLEEQSVTTNDNYIVDLTEQMRDHSIDVGEKLIITINGTKYECVAWQAIDINEVCIGDSRLHDSRAADSLNPEDVPFIIGYYYEGANPFDGTDEYVSWMITFNATGTHTLKIEKETGEIAVKPLDEKFIPESIARRSDPTSWNDLTDKPFGEDGRELVDVIPTTKTCTSLSGPDLQCLREIVVGQTYIITYDDEVFECVADINEYDNRRILRENDEGRYLEILSSPAYNYSWCEIIFEDFDEHTIRVQTYEATIKPLDEKYIPESIARVEDVRAMIEEYLIDIR